MATWFYMQGSERMGSVPFEELQGLAVSGTLSRTNLVWSEGMAERQRAGLIEGLFPDPPPYAASTPTPPPRETSPRP